MLPANVATGVPVDTLLRIGFDSTPTLGTTGTVNIYNAVTNALVDTLNVADPYAVYNGSTLTIPLSITGNAIGQPTSMVNVIGGLTTGIDQVRVLNYIPIMISGNTATIFPHNNKLAYNTTYYVTIDNSLFTGTVATVPFAGVAATAWTFTTQVAAPAAPTATGTTTVTVAADNSADFATVQGAIDWIPPKSSDTVIISIAPGVYQELLFLRNKKNITFLGSSNDNGLDTVIQYDNCDGFNPGSGAGQTVTTPGTGGTIPGYNGAAAGAVSPGGRPVFLMSSANGIVLNAVTVTNLQGLNSFVIPTLPTPTTITATESPTYTTAYSSGVTQAEALYFNSSFSTANPPVPPGTLVAEHSNFVSYQNTLQLKGFTWFYDCFVAGDTDFIYGNASVALFEQSEIQSRYNPSEPSDIVQSRAYLSFGTTTTPPAPPIVSSYPGFVFLNSALTQEVPPAGATFTAYLARSPGAPTVSGTVTPIFYLTYDIVSFIGCSMDNIAPVGWETSASTPGANIAPTPIDGWREYGSLTTAGLLLDVSQRLANPVDGGTATNMWGSIQLTAANVATFFPNRATILQGGATDGTYTTTGLAGFSPVP
jgi:pectin methylesterase-like acyl-CoA thioesterase